MKKFISAVVVICLMSITALVPIACQSQPATRTASECEAGYMKLVDLIKNSDKLTDAQKKEYAAPALEALEMCKEGKIEEARKMVNEMRQQGALDTVFQTWDKN